MRILFFLWMIFVSVTSVAAQTPQAATYSENELIDAGHRFFGQITGNFGQAMENTFQRWGRPNGYILGEEAEGTPGRQWSFGYFK